MKKGLKLCIGLIALSLLMVSGTWATLMTHFGAINTPVNVLQSVLLDDKNIHEMPIEDSFDAVGGDMVCRYHWLRNRANVQAHLQLVSWGYPEGVSVKYVKSLGYSTKVETVQVDTLDLYAVNVTAEDVGCAIKWTFDMKGNRELQGNGHWAYGLVIGVDGEGSPPAFQIHNNDGTDASYPWGTHLLSFWGPASTGFYGWHTSDRNTPVTEINWVDATGDRYFTDNPDGLFTVTISKCMLGTTFHWAVWIGVGGFYTPNNGYSTYPSAFTWVNSATVASDNYLEAIVGEEIAEATAFTLEPKQVMPFCICYGFAIDIEPAAFTIYTEVKLA